MLGGPLADAVAVATEGFLDGVGFLVVADGDVDQAYRFGFGAAGGSGDAGYSESQSRAGLAANAVGEGFGYFPGNCTVLGDQLLGNAGEGSLQFI